jgi:hypothetical protein
VRALCEFKRSRARRRTSTTAPRATRGRAPSSRGAPVRGHMSWGAAKIHGPGLNRKHHARKKKCDGGALWAFQPAWAICRKPSALMRTSSARGARPVACSPSGPFRNKATASATAAPAATCAPAPTLHPLPTVAPKPTSLCGWKGGGASGHPFGIRAKKNVMNAKYNQ